MRTCQLITTNCQDITDSDAHHASKFLPAKYKTFFCFSFHTSALYDGSYWSGLTTYAAVISNDLVIRGKLTWEQSHLARGSFSRPPVGINLVNLSDTLSLFERDLVVLGRVVACISARDSLSDGKSLLVLRDHDFAFFFFLNLALGG